MSNLLYSVYPLVFVWFASHAMADAYPPGDGSVPAISCPLNFSSLDALVSLGEEVRHSNNGTYKCASYVQALHFVMVQYVAQTGEFWVPHSSADACWNSFDQKLSSLGHRVDVRSECNFTTSSLAQGSDDCKNITTVQKLGSIVPGKALSEIRTKCINASLEWLSSCSACTTAIMEATYSFLPVGNSSSIAGSINGCPELLQIYGASAMNSSAMRAGVATCMWNLVLRTAHKPTRSKFIFGSAGALVMVSLTLGLLLSFYVRHRMRRVAVGKRDGDGDGDASKLEMMAKSNSNLTWYTLSEIKEATSNFAASNLVGCGGFGSVYRGVLADGAEVAVKRFKNCAHGDGDDDEFFHEIEVISSVKHRNLVPLRGCCVDRSDPRGGQVRIIVYDYMANGSLHDHLTAKTTASVLDWPKRQTIAVGIVKGLAYLHQEVQPAIIHRDIKSSNILLDSQWNARVADFGLARFTPEGATHVTTRVAGTHGYLAPEYALYGKLNEKSDVYSLGVLLLELLTGQKIISFSSSDSGGGPLLIADWAWPFVKQGKVADVLHPSIGNLGPPEVLEKYLRIALLCAHPQVSFRPTVDQVLRLMETDMQVPWVPDRPPPYTVTMGDLEKSSSSSSGGLSSSTSYRSSSSPPPVSVRLSLFNVPR